MYKRQVEELLHADEVIALARQAEAHYTTLVRDHISGMQKNALVTRCKEEVGKRLRQKITVVELAAELGVTRNYLDVYKRQVFWQGRFEQDLWHLMYRSFTIVTVIKHKKQRVQLDVYKRQVPDLQMP